MPAEPCAVGEFSIPAPHEWAEDKIKLLSRAQSQHIGVRGVRSVASQLASSCALGVTKNDAGKPERIVITSQSAFLRRLQQLGVQL